MLTKTFALSDGVVRQALVGAEALALAVQENAGLVDLRGMAVEEIAVIITG